MRYHRGSSIRDVLDEMRMGEVNALPERRTDPRALEMQSVPIMAVMQQPCIIAHRGASAIAPENTLLAFRLAAEAGAEMIETDAHLTRDGEIILMHDADLGRTTNCIGIIGDYCRSDIEACDTGYWFAPDGDKHHPFRGLGLMVPTLRGVFATLGELNPRMHVNVEIKNSPDTLGYDPGHRLASALVSLVREMGVAERTIVSSFNPEAIDRVKELDGGIRTAYLCAPWADVHARLAYAVARGHDALHPHHASMGPVDMARRIVDVVHRAGLSVNVWTVNDPERMRELATAGVDGIMTDDPGRLRAILETIRQSA